MHEVGPLRARTRAVADPGDLLALASRFPASPLVYWEHPADGHAMLAVGVAREIRARGPQRFAVAAEATARVLASVAGEVAPRMLGGFAFSDASAPDTAYPPARLVLPRRLWVRRAGRTTLTEVWDADEAPPAAVVADGDVASIGETFELRLHAPAVGAQECEEWRRRVACARALIGDGSARKIVLARRRRLVADRAIDPAAMLARARAARPGCFNVWVRPRRGPSLIASTPELLVRRRGADIAASALAGSAPRAAHRDEDDRLAAALLACPKNGREHALVVRAVRDALAALGADVAATPRPQILRLPEVQHLATSVRARASRPLSVLALGGALHPTPAVCGVPRAVARALIEREEPARGWYTGALGWTDAAGDGELVVTLRSALVDGATLEVWAGAGIVEGSDADAELAETEAKMRALVAPYLAPSTAPPATSAWPTEATA